MINSTFGVIVTNRSFFPAYLVTEARAKILKKLEDMGCKAIIVSEEDTPLGAVRTLSDAKKCAELFRKNQDNIDGIIVILPNFGEEVGVATAIDLARLNVPVLVQACDDSLDNMDISNRRDAFCGKLSLCNNLYQRNIKFTNTSLHTCDIDSEVFTADLERFAAVCRVVKGITSARVGAIGTRPDPFHTVRFSEKLLQAYGITVCVVDMADIIAKADSMERSEDVEAKIKEIKSYGRIPSSISEEKIEKQAKLCIVLENWVRENECDASAIQCWDSIQNNYGCATCLAMSMMGEKNLPSACEMDVTGALTMLALNLASGSPSAYLDWNNNYTDDRNRCVSLHCSNFPKSFFGDVEIEISNLDVLSTTIGKEKCFGACKAQVTAGPMTFAKITTDDKNGRIKAYIGEGEFLKDPVATLGGVALCQVDGLQELLGYMCKNGFEHHVAMSRSLSADILEEAFNNYLGWDVYRHRA